MELRNWISNAFGDTDSLLDESTYSETEIRKDKIRLRQQRKRVGKEMNELQAEYQRLLEEGAQASEVERQQYAQQAKIAKKKYKIKQQQYQKNSVQMATIVTIEGARELLEMKNADPTRLQGLLDDEGVEVEGIQDEMTDAMIEYELDMDLMMQVQEALDIDIIGADVDMGGGDEIEIMEDMEKGDIDGEQVDIGETVEDPDPEEVITDLDDEGLGIGPSNL